MFDEKSEKWIRIYKKITIAAFWCWSVFGILAAIDNWFIWEVFDIFLFGGEFWGGVLLLLCGFGIGFGQLVINMLVIQFLNNVQLIREKIENK